MEYDHRACLLRQAVNRLAQRRDFLILRRFFRHIVGRNQPLLSALNIHADPDQNPRHPRCKQAFVPEGLPPLPRFRDGLRHRVESVALPAQIAGRDAIQAALHRRDLLGKFPLVHLSSSFLLPFTH